MRGNYRVPVLCLLFILLFGLCSCSNAKNVEVEAENQLLQDLESYIVDEFEKSHLPGMSFEIVDEDSVLFEGSYGEAESSDQPFILGSLSKSFTALAIMQLEEKGLISLDAPVAKYLPEFDQSSDTTVRQLLTHTSGIKMSATMKNYRSSDILEPYLYSNQNYNLLGRIVEEVSGKDYGDYIQLYIFNPLGMTHSYVSYEEAEADDLIAGNRNYFGAYFHQKMPYPTDFISDWMSLSSAYITSSANDMGKYLQWYLGNSDSEILSVENRSRMFTETVFAAENYDYGFGWGIYDTNGTKFYLHGGNVENYTTYMLLIPDQNIGIIALTNSCDFLVADRYTISIPTNVAYKIIGWDTDNIRTGDYWKNHMIYDLIMLAVLIDCILPALFYSQWRKKEHNIIASLIFIAFIHIALPTFLLTVFSIVMDRPLDVVRRFAPDVFIILCICAACLYCIGVLKIIHLIRQKVSAKHHIKIV